MKKITTASLLGTAAAAWTRGHYHGPPEYLGGGDGWLASRRRLIFLGTANNERGLAFWQRPRLPCQPHRRKLYPRPDPLSGADLGTLNTTGVSGGNLLRKQHRSRRRWRHLRRQPHHSIDHFPEGLFLGDGKRPSRSSPTRRWGYSAGGRIGDDMAAIGSGASTSALGFNSTPAITGNKQLHDHLAQFQFRDNAFTGSLSNAGDFRLGITRSLTPRIIVTCRRQFALPVQQLGPSGTLLGSPAILTPPVPLADRLWRIRCCRYPSAGGREHWGCPHQHL